jgi:plasmid stabilization system protein ParE
MNYSFDPEARQELVDAALYYDAARLGLGEEFRTEIVQLISEACEHPTRWSKVSRRARRHRSGRFPYGVVYQIMPTEVRILAVMHRARRPGCWRHRLKP